jgi:hypothetical protein
MTSQDWHIERLKTCRGCCTFSFFDYPCTKQDFLFNGASCCAVIQQGRTDFSKFHSSQGAPFSVVYSPVLVIHYHQQHRPEYIVGLIITRPVRQVLKEPK